MSMIFDVVKINLILKVPNDDEKQAREEANGIAAEIEMMLNTLDLPDRWELQIEY